MKNTLRTFLLDLEILMVKIKMVKTSQRLHLVPGVLILFDHILPSYTMGCILKTFLFPLLAV